MPQPYRQRRGSRYDSQDSAEEWERVYNKACYEFQEGYISIDVFRAYMHGLGIGGQELESEINSNWPKKGKKP